MSFYRLNNEYCSSYFQFLRLEVYLFSHWLVQFRRHHIPIKTDSGYQNSDFKYALRPMVCWADHLEQEFKDLFSGFVLIL